MSINSTLPYSTGVIKYDYFVLPPLRSEEWNIQDDIKISQASVSLPSLSAMMVLLPGSSTCLSQALDPRPQNSLTKAYTHGLGHTHTQRHASVTDGAYCERDALIGCSTQACFKLSTVSMAKITLPRAEMNEREKRKKKYCFPAVCLPHQRFRQDKWKWQLLLWH